MSVEIESDSDVETRLRLEDGQVLAGADASAVSVLVAAPTDISHEDLETALEHVDDELQRIALEVGRDA